VVRAVYKDINDRVVQGEVLIDIDVPDLERDVAQKNSAVKQRRQELRVARAKEKDAEAGVEVAQTIVRQKQVEVTIAEGTCDFRRKRLARIRALAEKGSIGPDVVDEWERDTQASEAGVEAAKVGVDRAKADLKEAQSKVEAALADIDLKEASVEFAINEMEKARAVAEFARITAPFDGVVTRRNVDPGSFVQNATTGNSETLMSVVRTDLVTVVSKFPDNAAPFVTRDTPASIQIDEVPGLSLAGRVTRFSPSIQNSDRTMRIEVDLFNGSEEDYQKMVRSTVAATLGSLGGGHPFGLTVLRAASRAATEGFRKGPHDQIPCRAAAANSEGLTPNLLPGMSGMLQLELGRFENSYVLPSGAVFSRGGKPYVLLCRKGPSSKRRSGCR
jgi:multidrug resistance efflux pump